jgi:hypothetical protein
MNPGGTIVCPSDDGARDVAFFRYRHLPDDIVLVKLNGCAFISNGSQRRILGHEVAALLQRAT